MKGVCKRSYFFTSLKIFLRENKTCILLGCVSALAGIVIGIIAARSFGEDYYKLNIFFEVNSTSYSYAKTFFTALAFALGGMALILICGINKWLIIAAFIWTGYTGYRLGLGLVGCLQPGTLMGVMCIIFHYLPLYFAAISCFIGYICMVFSSICSPRGVFASAASVKKLIFRALPLLVFFFAVDFICTILIPLLYKLFFM